MAEVAPIREATERPTQFRGSHASGVDSGGMSPLELLAIAFGALVIGGCVVLGFRLSGSQMAALRERVAVVDATLAELARRLELDCRVAPPYRHPVVGEVPSYAQVVGERSGWGLRVAFEADEDDGNFVVTVAPRDGVRLPELGRVPPARGADRFPSLAPAFARLGDGAAELRVQPSELRVVVRSPSATAEELRTLVDASLALAAALTTMP